jgi:hypothetical protein
MRDGVCLFGVRVRGPLAGYAEGFADELVGQGYSAGSTRLQLQLVARVSRWLDAEELDAAGLTTAGAVKKTGSWRWRWRPGAPTSAR